MFSRALVAAVAALALAAPLASGQGKTSHKGWPKINGDLKMHKQDENGELRATEVNKHNELLGGHGNDVIGIGRVQWRMVAAALRPGGSEHAGKGELRYGPM